jgi:hypothetical protein
MKSTAHLHLMAHEVLVITAGAPAAAAAAAAE